MFFPLPYNQDTSCHYQSCIIIPEDDMHILSLSDIKLLIDLFEANGVVADAGGRERQISSLIKMGYLRPLSGVYVLTELGEKTARSLAMRKFVPSMMLPASEPAAGGSAEMPAAIAAEASANAEPETTAEESPAAPTLEEA